MSTRVCLLITWRLVAVLALLLVSACTGGQPLTAEPSPPTAATQLSPQLSPATTVEATASSVPTLTPSPIPTAAPTPLPSPTVAAWPTLAPDEGLVRRGEPLPVVAGPITAKNFGALVTLARWGKGNFEDAGFSPDGHYFGVETNLGRYLYDAATGKEIPPDESILQAIFPPEQDRYTIEPIASCCEPAISGLELLRDGESLAKLEAHLPYAFSPDGNNLATAAEDESYHDLVKLWSLADGSLLAALPLQGEDFSGQEITCQEVSALAFNPEGQSLTVACRENNLIYSLPLDGSPTRLLLDTQMGFEMFPRSLLFSPDGTRLAGSFENGEGRLWDLASGEALPAPVESSELFSPIAFSPDGARLAVSTFSGILLWDLSAGENVLVHSHSWPISQFAITPDGKQVIFDPGWEITIANLADGSLISQLPDLDPHHYYMAISPDGRYLALQIVDVTPSDEAFVGIRQLPIGERVESLRATITYAGPHLDFLPDGRLGLLVGDQVQLFSPGDWGQVGTITAPGGVLAFDFSPDGETAALLSGKGVELRRVQTGRVERRLKNLPEIQVWELGYSPDGSLLLIRGVDLNTEEAVLLFYNLEQDKVAYQLDDIYSTWAFSPNGEILLTPTNGEILFRRASDGIRLGVLSGPPAGVVQVGFTPDSRYLITTSSDGSLRVWGIPE